MAEFLEEFDFYNMNMPNNLIYVFYVVMHIITNKNCKVKWTANKQLQKRGKKGRGTIDPHNLADFSTLRPWN
jgi:hypothetical protein